MPVIRSPLLDPVSHRSATTRVPSGDPLRGRIFFWGRRPQAPVPGAAPPVCLTRRPPEGECFSFWGRRPRSGGGAPVLGAAPLAYPTGGELLARARRAV